MKRLERFQATLNPGSQRSFREDDLPALDFELQNHLLTAAVIKK